MNDEKLKSIAQKVISKANIESADQQRYGSVIAILMVISIILTLIRVIQECKKTKLKTFSQQQDRCSFFSTEVKSLSFNRTWFTKRAIKRVLKQQLSKEDYNKYYMSFLNAILDCGSTITEDETYTLMEAANV